MKVPKPVACSVLTRYFVAAFGVAVTGLAGGYELNGYAVLTTDYVFRGFSYSDDAPAIQLGGELAFDSDFYVGVWASTVDIANGTGGQRDLEINYYLGFNHPVNNEWTIGANVVAYTFPGADGFIDYDYFEYSLTFNYEDRAWLEYSLSPDFYHSGEATQHLALYTEWPVFEAFVASVGAGYYDVSKLTGDDYTHWEAGITRPFGRASVDLRYHDASRWVALVNDPALADSRVVLSMKVGF